MSIHYQLITGTAYIRSVISQSPSTTDEAVSNFQEKLCLYTVVAWQLRFVNIAIQETGQMISDNTQII